MQKGSIEIFKCKFVKCVCVCVCVCVFGGEGARTNPRLEGFL